MPDMLSHKFLENHPKDAARVLERLEPREAALYLEAQYDHAAGSAFASLSSGFALSCMTFISEEKCGDFLCAMPHAQATALLARIDREKREGILRTLPEKIARRLKKAIAVPDGYIAGAIESSVMVVNQKLSAADATRQARKSGDRLEDYIFVVDDNDCLTGTLNARELLLCDPKKEVAVIMNRKVVSLPLRTSLAAVASHPAWRQYHILPVIDRNGRFQGILRRDRLAIGDSSYNSGRELQGVLDAIFVLAFAYWSAVAKLTVFAVSKNPPSPQN